MDHFSVQDFDYDKFQDKARLEDDTNISRGPINVRKGIIPNLTGKTVLDATATPKSPNNLDVGRNQMKKMPNHIDEFSKQDASSKGFEKRRRIAAIDHIVFDADKVVRENNENLA